MKWHRLILVSIFLVFLLLAAPAVADTQSTVTLTVYEVSVVKDSSAQDIIFTLDGESDTSSAFVAQGGSVTLEVLSPIPSDKNLTITYDERIADNTTSRMTVVFSNITGNLVVNMKLEPTGGTEGPKPSEPGTSDDTGEPEDPIVKSYSAIVGADGTAGFADHDVIIRVSVPAKYAGKKIEIIDHASVEAADHMDIYHQADIHLHFELEDGDQALVHFRIPASEFKARGLTENDACLYHYSEKDGWTKLPTWHYSIEDGYLIYESETDDFSPFAIVFEEGAAMSKDTGEPVAPTELPVCLGIALLTLLLLAGIGAAVILRRRKNVEKQ